MKEQWLTRQMVLVQGAGTGEFRKGGAACAKAPGMLEEQEKGLCARDGRM